MEGKKLLAQLALQSVTGVGDIMSKRLLSHCGSVEDIFKETDKALLAIDGIGSKTLQAIRNPENFKRAEAEMNFIIANKVNVLHFSEGDYPAYLKQCIDAPVLLFSSGNMDINNRKIISIVGTRNITQQGIEFCNQLIADLAPFNPIIVSGFAYGVDITAHLAAINNNLDTIGVLAHGLDQIYPKVHQKYVNSVNKKGGFLTEYHSGGRPDRENFVKRNRIVAGMSEATIVVESAEKGGSMITANLANDYSRDVFAVPGRITDIYSQGCNKLIKINKAHLLSSAADIEYILNWDKEDSKPKNIQPKIALEPIEETIYNYLNQNGKTVLDEIAVDCDIPTFKLSSILLTMELKEAIRPLPGKLFEVK